MFNPIAAVRDFVIARVVKQRTIAFLRSVEGYAMLESLAVVIKQILNLGGFLEGHRTQLIAGLKGIIMGAGAVGLHLPFDVDGVQFWLTRALVYFAILKGSHVAEDLAAFIALHGGKVQAPAVVMVAQAPAVVSK